MVRVWRLQPRTPVQTTSEYPPPPPGEGKHPLPHPPPPPLGRYAPSGLVASLPRKEFAPQIFWLIPPLCPPTLKNVPPARFVIIFYLFLSANFETHVHVFRAGAAPGYIDRGGGQNIYFGENSCARQRSHLRVGSRGRAPGGGPGGVAPGSSRFLGYQIPQIVIIYI